MESTKTSGPSKEALHIEYHNSKDPSKEAIYSEKPDVKLGQIESYFNLESGLSRNIPSAINYLIHACLKYSQNRYELHSDYAMFEVHISEMLIEVFPDKNFDEYFQYLSEKRFHPFKNVKNDFPSEYFTQEEKEHLSKVANTFDKIITDRKIVPIIAVYSVPYDNEYNYIHTEGCLFKIKKEISFDKQGALEVGLFPKNQFLVDEYFMEVTQKGNDRIDEMSTSLKRVKNYQILSPVQYILGFITKEEYEDSSITSIFEKSHNTRVDFFLNGGLKSYGET